MKEKMNFKNLNELIQTAKVLLKLGLVVAIGGLIVLSFYIIEKTQILNIILTILGIIFPLFIGMLTAWLFEPLIKKLEKKKVSRVLGTTIVYLSFILVLVLLLWLVVPEFVEQLKELIGQVPGFLTKAQEFIASFFNKFQNSTIDVESIKAQLIAKVEEFANNLSSDSLTSVINSITKFVSEGFNVLLGILIGFYLSLDFKKFSNSLSNLIPMKYRDDTSKLLENVDEMARGYVSGTLFTSLLVAFLTFLGLVIAGVSSPLLFAIFCGITNIIPYFGPYIGGIPVVVVAFSISPMCGIITLVTIVLVQFVEGNIIHPLVVGKAVDIHPVVVVLSLLVFEHFFGIIGMILATPIVGAIKILIVFLNEKYHFMNKIMPDKIEVK